MDYKYSYGLVIATLDLRVAIRSRASNYGYIYGALMILLVIGPWPPSRVLFALAVGSLTLVLGGPSGLVLQMHNNWRGDCCGVYFRPLCTRHNSPF